MWEPRPLQVKSSTPAGRAAPSASVCACSASRRSSSADAPSRICIRTVCPTLTRSPMARLPDSESAPMIGRTRKSPRPYSGLFSSMTMPEHQAGRRELLLAGVEAGEGLAQPLDGRLRGQLRDHVPLRSRDRHLGAHGRGPLRDARQQRHARERATDRAPVQDLAVAEQRRGAGGRGAREPTQHRHAGPQLAETAQQRLGREAVWVGKDDQRVANGVGLGYAHELEAVGGLLRLEVMRSDLGLRHRGGPDDRAGPSSISLPPPTTPPAPQPIRWRGLEVLVNRREDPFAAPEVWSPGEHQTQVARLTVQRAGGVPRRVRERLDRVEALRDPNAHAHRHASNVPGRRRCLASPLALDGREGRRG